MDQQPNVTSPMQAGQPPSVGTPTLAYAMPSTTQAAFQPTHGLAKVVVVFFVVLCVVQAISFFSTYAQVELLREARDGAGITDADAESNDQRQNLIAVVYAVVLIGLVIVFLRWFHRSYRNAGALGALRLKYTPGWAVGYWFIPIMNLFRPYQVAKEIYQTSDPAADASDWWTVPVAGVLGWWWTAWIFFNVSSRVGNQSSRKQPTLDSLIFSSWADIVCSVLGIIAAVLAIKVVRLITERQAAKFESQQAHPLAAAPWASPVGA